MELGCKSSISFFIRVSFRRHWRFARQQGKGCDHLHSSLYAYSRSFRHLWPAFHMRCLPSIFNHRGPFSYHIFVLLINLQQISTHKSSPSEVFLQKVFLKICSKFTGEHLCRRTLLQGCFYTNKLRIWNCNRVNYHPITTKETTNQMN